MKPSYCKSGMNYLPVIIHEDGNRETLFGPPCANIPVAKKYAACEIVPRWKKGN